MAYTQRPVTVDRPVRVGLIGAGWIGHFHAESIALRVPNARFEAIADPALKPMSRTWRPALVLKRRVQTQPMC